MIPPWEHGKSFTSLQYQRALMYLLLTLYCPKHLGGQKTMLKGGRWAKNHSMKRMWGFSEYQKEMKSLTYLTMEYQWNHNLNHWTECCNSLYHWDQPNCSSMLKTQHIITSKLANHMDNLVWRYPPGSTWGNHSLHYQNCLCTMLLGGNRH